MCLFAPQLLLATRCTYPGGQLLAGGVLISTLMLCRAILNLARLEEITRPQDREKMMLFLSSDMHFFSAREVNTYK